MIDEYRLPGEDVFPEGITEDPDGARFYVSSAGQGTVFRGHIDTPELEVWQASGVDGRTEALGMAVDGHGRLLVCGGSTGHIFAFDTRSGAQLARHTVAAETALLNDVCVAGGAAYVTDSIRPVLWRVPLDGGVGKPEEFTDLTRYGADPDAVHYLNGIVPAAGGSALVVAAQGTGRLWRVDTATGEASPIASDAEAFNIDGMVYAGGLLYACANTDEPDGSYRLWLAALRLAPDAGRAELVGRWERRLEDSITTAAYLGGRLFLVNSQFWGRRNGGARAPFTVSAFPPPL